MKHGTQIKICKIVGVTSGFLLLVMSGLRRPSWPTAKRLAAATGSTPDQWMEAPPETFRRIISEYALSRESASWRPWMVTFGPP